MTVHHFPYICKHSSSKCIVPLTICRCISISCLTKHLARLNKNNHTCRTLNYSHCDVQEIERARWIAFLVDRKLNAQSTTVVRRRGKKKYKLNSQNLSKGSLQPFNPSYHIFDYTIEKFSSTMKC